MIAGFVPYADAEPGPRLCPRESSTQRRSKALRRCGRARFAAQNVQCGRIFFSNVGDVEVPRVRTEITGVVWLCVFESPGIILLRE